jgi:hypothetical protein
VPEFTQKIKLCCVCGKSLDVLAKPGSDILSVARANSWKILGGITGNEMDALCPTCKGAEEFIARQNVAFAKRN